MCEFIKITFKDSKKNLKYYKKACAVLLIIAMLSGNTLCSIPIKNQPAHAAGDVAINATNFPDDNFRAWISDAANVPHAGASSLTQAECENVKGINVSNSGKGLGIKSLTGIEFFTALETLNCNKNQIAALDISHNTALIDLRCYANKITALDVSKNTKLASLACSNNQISAIDVSKNAKLTNLACSNNQITDLNVNQNTSLTTLDCSNNKITAMDVSKNAKLTTLSCSSNPISFLDVSLNTALTSLECVNNQIAALDVRNNTALTDLECGSNQITGLDVSLNTALIVLDCDNNQIAALDVSKNSNLQALTCDDNQLTDIDVSKNSNLQSLTCDYNKLTKLNVSKIDTLTHLECSGNKLTKLALNPNLQILYCTENNLTTLDLIHNTAITELACSGQTTIAPLQYNGSNYFVNMADVVGADNLTKVSSAYETWLYDPQTGAMTYNGNSVPTTLVYNYDTDLSASGTEQLMDVTATLSLYSPTVTFHPNNGDDSFQKAVDVNGKVAVPADPTLTNFKFLGWYTSTDGGQTLSAEPYDFNTVLTSSIDLYAKWMCWVEFPDVGAIVAANNGGTFSDYLSGSNTLHVDLLDTNGDTYKSLYPQLASATGNKLTGVQIFDVYFTDESGTRVAAQDFGENIEIYLKVPDGWDYNNMKAFYVTTGGAETYSMVNEVINGVPYIHITTNHFSNYAIVNTRTTSSALATGDNSFMSICALSGLLFYAGATLIISKKKKEDLYK